MIKNIIFNPGNYPPNINLVLMLLRLAVGAGMLTHGMGKFSKLIGDDPIQFADPIGVGATASLALTVFSEVFCSVLLILGLISRFAAIPLFITMFVVAFIVHGNEGFREQELAILYAVIYLVIAITGAGKYSIDTLIHKR